MTGQTFKITGLTFNEKVIEVQSQMIVAKTDNEKVSYKSRSAEQIQEIAKPILKEAGLAISVDQELNDCNGRIFIKSTAMLTDGDSTITGSGIAELLMPPVNASGKYSMNLAQACGATGSYSDKIALENVLGIGASEDADHNNYKPSDTPTQSYSQPVQNNVDNVDPETFKDLCFVGKNLGLEAEQIKKVWDYARKIGGYTRGKWNPDTKEWTGTNIPSDALRPILTAFAKEAGQDPNVLLAQFGINALSEIKSVDDYSDEPF